jgi:uroporphyrinogen-III synthase
VGLLDNRKIALAEARELDLLAGMLEREGAAVLRCPLVAIKDAPDAAPVEAWLKRVISGGCDDIIFYTGEGIRRLLGFAARAGAKDDFIAALTQVRKITRGPKPVKALRENGLEPDLTAEAPTTDGLIATLQRLSLKGRRVGVQIYGQEPNTKFVDFLTGAGAEVHLVAPYIYASDADNAQVESCIRKLADGEIDVIAFTSSPQLRRLEEVATQAGLSATLKQGLTRAKIAAVGPIMAAELERRGIKADAMPETSFTMKPLVKAIARLLAA